jgi:hypothetical protein
MFSIFQPVSRRQLPGLVRIKGFNAISLADEYGLVIVCDGADVSREEISPDDVSSCYVDCPAWVVRDSGVLGS